jgi:hypothetical protein
MPISGGGQPAFSSTASDAVWFEEWHRDAPDLAPCPDGPGHASNTFKNLSVQNGNTLQFTDKNKDSKRYAYALRCMVGSNLVVDDPVIVNK